MSYSVTDKSFKYIGIAIAVGLVLIVLYLIFTANSVVSLITTPITGAENLGGKVVDSVESGASSIWGWVKSKFSSNETGATATNSNSASAS